MTYSLITYWKGLWNGHSYIIFRQLLTPKKVMLYNYINSREIVWFGKFWLDFQKYHINGILPTQFLSKTQISYKNSKLSRNKDFEKSSSYQACKRSVNFKNLYFLMFSNSDMKFLFFDKNWVEKMPHKW